MPCLMFVVQSDISAPTRACTYTRELSTLSASYPWLAAITRFETVNACLDLIFNKLRRIVLHTYFVCIIYVYKTTSHVSRNLRLLEMPPHPASGNCPHGPCSMQLNHCHQHHHRHFPNLLYIPRTACIYITYMPTHAPIGRSPINV